MKTEEDALNIIINTLREHKPEAYAWAGYGVYLPHIIRLYIATHEKLDDMQTPNRIVALSPLFYNAAWNLCRRGILRPGVMKHGEQATSEANAGNGYTVTPFGKTWLAESGHDNFVPTEPERFAFLIEPYKFRFGEGFHQRTQEAIRCYGAHAFLACCAMCGAAAESILLSIAIAKKGDENTILSMYSGAKGRYAVEKYIIKDKQGQDKKAWIGTTFQNCTGLLQFWRDESAHGQTSGISDNEAHTALLLLLRFAKFANDNWKLLLQ